MDYCENDGLKLENQLCFPMYVCSKEIIRRYKPFLDPLDLTYTQYIVLLALWDKESLTVKALGKILYLDSGTLTPVLKKLEAKEYVSRERDPQDERSVILSITPRGAELKEKVKDIPRQVGVCMNLCADDLDRMRSVTRQILEEISDEE